MNGEDLIKNARQLALSRVRPGMGVDEKADLLEMALMDLLHVQIIKPPVEPVGPASRARLEPAGGGKWLIGDDPRLPRMHAKPTLIDFFNYRFKHDTKGSSHLLQRAKLARTKGCSE